MTRVYLIRHAEVENPNRVLYGHLPGFPLSARGREQAAELGRRLRSSGIRRIVHSPLERAQETARIIASQLDQPAELIPEPELREAEFGRYLQGVPYWQIPLRRPLWFAHKARRGLLPGDEAMRDLGGRIVAVMNRVAEEHPDQVSALVSHADPLQAAWVLLENRPQSERELYRKPVDRAGTLEVDLDGGRVVEVRYVAPPRRGPAGTTPEPTAAQP
jgi:broad specificity phosphatase PhoE